MLCGPYLSRSATTSSIEIFCRKIEPWEQRAQVNFSPVQVRSDDAFRTKLLYLRIMLYVRTDELEKRADADNAVRALYGDRKYQAEVIV
jgi:hypothetical protein